LDTRLRWNIAQFAELNWWKNYLKKRDVTEYIEYKVDYWEGILKECSPEISIKENLSVLDAGCGPAGIFMVCTNQQVLAIDLLINEYEKYIPHYRKETYPNVKFVNSSIEDFSSDTQFDIVFCMNAINHVNQIDDAYEVICNMVKPGGKLVITIDAHNYPLFKKIFKLLPGDVLHPHQFDIDEYTMFITKRNFKVEKQKLIKKEFFFNHYLQIASKPF